MCHESSRVRKCQTLLRHMEWERQEPHLWANAAFSCLAKKFWTRLYLVGGDWNMTFIFPYIGNNHSNWLSYFSEGLKPPTRWAICRLAFIGNGGNAPSSLRRRGVHPARTETPQTPQPKIRILVSLSMLVILFIPCQQGKWCDFRSSIINHYQQSHH